MSEIDDGSGKPEGHETPDGHLRVQDGEYHETELGQHHRWMSQAPDLFEKYMALLGSRGQSIVSQRDETDGDGFQWTVLVFGDGRTAYIPHDKPWVWVEPEQH